MEVFLPIAQVFINPVEILLLSAIVGVLSGLFGVGGGFLMTPFLIFMGVPPAYAVANKPAFPYKFSINNTTTDDDDGKVFNVVQKLNVGLGAVVRRRSRGTRRGEFLAGDFQILPKFFGIHFRGKDHGARQRSGFGSALAVGSADPAAFPEFAPAGEQLGDAVRRQRSKDHERDRPDPDMICACFHSLSPMPRLRLTCPTASCPTASLSNGSRPGPSPPAQRSACPCAGAIRPAPARSTPRARAGRRGEGKVGRPSQR